MSERIVTVSKHAYRLLEKAGITPPDEGQFNVAALDAKLKDGGFDTETRMTIKLHLRDAGLLTPGRLIDDARR
jgi:hypothetical protein